MTNEELKQQRNNPFKMLISGAFGGMCSIVVGYPLDTIKVRLQTMERPQSGEQPVYLGTIDCAKKIILKEGPLGLYKGMLVPLYGVMPIHASSFFGYSLGKYLQQTDDLPLTYWQIVLAGSFSGLLSSLLCAPGERIKCLLQVQNSAGAEKKYNGAWDTTVKLFKEGGIRSNFRGLWATILRDVPANGLYFVVYEYLQDVARKRSGNDEVSMLSTFFAGGTAGISYWLLGMPADVLKSRIQTAPEGTYPHGIRSAFAELIQKDGLIGLYSGVRPVMLRAFPANAVCFFGMEMAYKCINRIFPNF